MPRTVILKDGTIIRNVPDDVTDEDVERKEEERRQSRKVKEEEEGPSPRRQESGLMEEDPEPRTPAEEPSRTGRRRGPRDRVSNSEAFTGAWESFAEGATDKAKAALGVLQAFGDETGRMVRGGIIEPTVNNIIGIRGLVNPENEAKEKAMTTALLNLMIGKKGPPDSEEEPTFQIDEDGRIDAENAHTFVGTMAPYIVGYGKAYGVASKAMTNLPKLLRVGLSANVAGQITEQALSNPFDANVFNLMQDIFDKDQQNAVLEFLASDEDDTEAEGRLKLAMQDASLTALFMSIPAFTKGVASLSGEVTDRIIKHPFSSIKDSEAGELFVQLFKKIKRKPRGSVANPGARQAFEEGGESASGVAFIERLAATPADGGVLTRLPHKLFTFARKAHAQFLTSKGYMTDDQFMLFNESVASNRAIIQQAENTALKLNNLIRNTAMGISPDDVAQYGWKETPITRKMIESADEIAENVNIVLTRGANYKNVAKKLPKEIRETVKAARTLIDKLSNELMDSPTVSQELRETIEANVGSYLRRTYKAFTTQGWKPSSEVYQEAQEEVAERLLKSKGKQFGHIVDRDVAMKRAGDILNGMLDGDRGRDYITFSNRMMKINDSIFRKRKSLTPAIRKFLGEETDPAMKIVTTVEAMSDMVYKHRWYESMERLGKGKWLHQGAPSGVYNTKVTGTNSLLDGQYTTPQMAKVLAGTEAQTSDLINGKFWRGYGWLKGVSQKAKTVWSHPTHMKNAIGGFGFRAANGYGPFSPNSERAMAIVQDHVRKGGDEGLEKVYQQLLDLGIINTNTRINEFRQLIDDGVGNSYKIVENITGAVERATKKVAPNKLSLYSQLPDQIYMATDDYFKINTFYDYADTLRGAFPGLSEEDVMREAAAVTRNIIPNYDLVPKGIKELRRLPFSNFAGFNAEIARTTVNIVKLGFKEIQSGNKVLVERGMNRLLGLTTTAGGGITAAAAVSQKLVGLESDEQRKSFVHLMEREWSENPTVFARISEDGKMYGLDVSTINPYTFIVKPVENVFHEIFEGVMSEEALDEMLFDAAGAFLTAGLQPFLDESIASTPILDTARVFLMDGRTVAGRQIKGEGIPMTDTGMEIVKSFWKALEPGTLTALGRAMDAAEGREMEPLGIPRNMVSEMDANLSGMRWTEIRPIENLVFSVGDYSRKSREIANIQIDFSSTPEDILESYRLVNKAHYENQVEMYKDLKAVIGIGVPVNEALNTLRDKGGLSNEDTQWLYAGKYRPPEDIHNIMFRSFERVFNDKPVPKTFGMTWQELQYQLARESAGMRGISLETFSEEENQFRDSEQREEAIQILRQGRR